jgi:hypothetical protein
MLLSPPRWRLGIVVALVCVGIASADAYVPRRLRPSPAKLLTTHAGERTSVIYKLRTRLLRVPALRLRARTNAQAAEEVLVHARAQNDVVRILSRGAANQNIAFGEPQWNGDGWTIHVTANFPDGKQFAGTVHYRKDGTGVTANQLFRRAIFGL